MVDIVDAVGASLVHILTWRTLSWMLAGIGIGFWVGVLPGIGAPAALALMLPFTFKMEPFQAFAFLLGMTGVTSTTGHITSILFGVPGEANTAATVVDGHQMAKKGEAGRALGAALTSSLVGACFGAFSLAVAIPVVRPLVLTVGYGEFFMLSLLGITLVASLSKRALIKGLIAGGIGLMLSTVGVDPNAGIQRYTFGQLFLWDGVGLVPVTLGLFAIPELIDLAVAGTSIAQERAGRLGGVLVGVNDAFRHWGLVLRCSAIGTYFGIIPGMGSAVSQWLAYAHAVQSSPDKDRFGKGAVEGVLGPAAADNSALGGNLVPTVAFGVPSSVVTAILLGAFLIQGIVPGPTMLVPEREGGHLTLTLSFVWVIIVSHVITVAVTFLFLNQLTRVTKVRGNLLIPFVLLLIYLGAFAEKNAFEDLIVTLVFGALGWAMIQLDWPRPPLLLALVLGPLMENNLFLATTSSGAAWLGRPGVLFLAAVIVGSITYAMLQARREQPQRGEVATEKARAKFSWGTLASLFIIAIFVWAVWQSRNWGWRTALFPDAIGFTVLPLAIVQLALDFLNKKAPEKSKDGVPEVALPVESTGVLLGRMISIWGWIASFFVAIWLLGFSIAAPVATILYLKVGGREKSIITALLAMISWILFGWLFHCFLQVPFPDGLIVSQLEKFNSVGLNSVLRMLFLCKL